ncbi:Asp23/Gls24 family envelope stress response protein [Rhodococcus sp. NPDC058521]|uniref:Asp23/Gls24 family envelope stress response protein n=1 Tax=Rhodococcus sp. NPDC058521 TaxID=3346536 RepID=UPI00366041B2
MGNHEASPDISGEATATPDSGDRGTLVIRDKVAQKLATKAALDTPGVEKHSAGLAKLTGRDLPRARVYIAGDRVRAHVDVAVEWPNSLPRVGDAVRSNVASALSDYAGLNVDGVDVSIPSVVSPSGEDTGRNIQ